MGRGANPSPVWIRPRQPDEAARCAWGFGQARILDGGFVNTPEGHGPYERYGRPARRIRRGLGTGLMSGTPPAWYVNSSQRSFPFVIALAVYQLFDDGIGRTGVGTSALGTGTS